MNTSECTQISFNNFVKFKIIGGRVTKQRLVWGKACQSCDSSPFFSLPLFCVTCRVSSIPDLRRVHPFSHLDILSAGASFNPLPNCSAWIPSLRMNTRNHLPAIFATIALQRQETCGITRKQSTATSFSNVLSLIVIFHRRGKKLSGIICEGFTELLDHSPAIIRDALFEPRGGEVS